MREGLAGQRPPEDDQGRRTTIELGIGKRNLCLRLRGYLAPYLERHPRSQALLLLLWAFRQLAPQHAAAFVPRVLYLAGLTKSARGKTHYVYLAIEHNQTDYLRHYIYRRHLSEGQKAAVAVGLMPTLGAERKWGRPGKGGKNSV
jgi:hypothetical protein